MVVNWAIGFPYCPNEPIRAEAFELASSYYRNHFPHTPQLTHSATPQGEPFLRAKTRNELVTILADEGCSVVVLIDADTLIHPDAIRAQVERATHHPMYLGKPFLRGVNLPITEQKQLAAGLIPWPRARFNDPGAAWVIRPESWWAAGGMDENFTGWGGEDEAFSYLFAAAGGVTGHGQLPAVKTQHEQARWGTPEHQTAVRRELVTKHIWKNPHLLTEWLEVRDRPGVVDEWTTKYLSTLR